ELRQKWINEYDPSSLLPRCRVPILFVNGTNDVHYPLDSYMKSFDCVPGFKQLRIQVNMGHGHPPGWAPQEIGIFIDSFCRGGDALPVIGKLTVEGEEIRASYTAKTPLKEAKLNYTTDSGLRSKRQWKSVPTTLSNGVISAPKPPADANTWFLTATDERGAMVSSAVQFAP
ncbi:MAG: acylamino acid-releasing protein, partial [Proteobacteria bacterium]|nr:acylamino acid-releasing protein [Pseudomonadota bacterium]